MSLLLLKNDLFGTICNDKNDIYNANNDIVVNVNFIVFNMEAPNDVVSCLHNNKKHWLFVIPPHEWSDLSGHSVWLFICPFGWFFVDSYKKYPIFKIYQVMKNPKPKCISGHSEQLWFLDPRPPPLPPPEMR